MATTKPWLPPAKSPLTDSEKAYHVRYQARVAATVEADWKRYEQLLAARTMKPQPLEQIAKQLLQQVRQEVKADKLKQLAIGFKYCHLDPPDAQGKTVFIHRSRCPCRVKGYTDPDVDEESHITPMQPWPRQVLDFIEKQFKQGGEVWKSLHKHFLSGTSLHGDAGFSTEYKPYSLHLAIRYGFLVEEPGSFSCYLMAAGKHQESKVCARTAGWLKVQSLIPSNSDIRRSDGLKFPANDGLTWLSHSCDGLIEELRELVEFKVKYSLIKRGTTFEQLEVEAPVPEYMAQCQLGMMVYERRRCRLLYFQNWFDVDKEPDHMYAYEFYIDFTPDYLQTMVRRAALCIFCQEHRIWPVPAALMAPFVNVVVPQFTKRRIRM